MKKNLLYEMKFLVSNYSCLQNPWLVGYRPQIPVLSVLCPQLNLLNPPRTKFLGTPLVHMSSDTLTVNWFCETDMLPVSTYHFLNKVTVNGVIFASLNTESCSDVGLRWYIHVYIYEGNFFGYRIIVRKYAFTSL